MKFAVKYTLSITLVLLLILSFVSCAQSKGSMSLGDKNTRSATETVDVSSQDNPSLPVISEPVSKAETSSEEVSSYQETQNQEAEISSEIMQEQDKFISRIRQLDVNNISKLVVTHSVTYSPSVDYETTDKDLISRWITLLNKMEFTSKAGNGVTGSPSSLIKVYDNNNQVEYIGCFLTCYAFNIHLEDEVKAVHTITNYEQVKDEFKQLEDEMGIENI